MSKNKKTPKASRGGLAAAAMETSGAKTKGRGRKPKTAKSEAGESPTKESRKQAIRRLYQQDPPLKKSEIVDALVKEGHGADDAKDRARLRSAVDNEASYMKNDGLSPKWKGEDRAPAEREKAAK